VILLIALMLLGLRIIYSLGEIYFERDWPRKTWRGILTAAILVILCASAFGQAARVDIPLLTAGPNVPITGGPLPQALWVANSTAYICTHPSSTLVACQSSLVPTFTDATEGATCPPSTQLVQLPGSTCTSSTGAASNLGFWYGGGIVDYWVATSYGAFGPFTINSPTGSGAYISSTQTSPQTMAGPLDTSINGVPNALLCGGSNPPPWCSGSDIGAWINAAYAELPSTGGKIQVSPIPAGGLTQVTPVVIGTLSKPAVIECSPGPGTLVDAGAIYFSPTSGTAFTFNYGGNGTSHPSGAGLRDCSITGNAGTSVGILLGGTNGAEGAYFGHDGVYNFGIDVLYGNNTWRTKFDNSVIQGNNSSVLLSVPNSLTNSGEELVFDSTAFLNGQTNGVQIAGSGIEADFIDCSFDDTQVATSASFVNMFNPHFENPGTSTISYPYVVNSGGNLNLTNPQIFQDYSTATASEMVNITGGSVNMTGADLSSTLYTYPNLFAISNAANFYELSPLNLGGSNNSFITGSTTGRYWIDTGNGCSGAQCQSFLSNDPAVFSVPSLLTTNDAYARWGISAVPTSTASGHVYTGTPDTTGFYHSHVAIAQETATNGCAGNYSSGLNFYTESKATANATDTSILNAFLDCLGGFHANALTAKGSTATIGYATGGGAGCAVTQATSRTTGVTCNASTGGITLFSAAGSSSYTTFTVTDTAIAATDCLTVSLKSGTVSNNYNLLTPVVGAGSFSLTFNAVAGTATDAPVINFGVMTCSAN
jgi:hypothetical protein